MNQEPDSAWAAENQRNKELTKLVQELSVEKAKLFDELNFIKKALLEKPVIATLTDDQAERLGKAIGHYVGDIVKSVVKDGKTTPLVN